MPTEMTSRPRATHSTWETLRTDRDADVAVVMMCCEFNISGPCSVGVIVADRCPELARRRWDRAARVDLGLLGSFLGFPARSADWSQYLVGSFRNFLTSGARRGNGEK